MTKNDSDGCNDSNKVTTFEQSLEELKLIVQQLEDGQLGLSESLARYEEGMKHYQWCNETLEKAERKIELLAGVDADGNPVTRPFEDEETTLEQKQKNRAKRRSHVENSDVDEPGALF